MALSWYELTADHKIIFLLESLANEKEQQAPIACRFCDEIFFDNKSLLNHFQFHLHQAGASYRRSLAGSSVPSENSSNFISQPSQYTQSFLVPVNARDYVAHGNIGPSSWKNISPNMPKLSQGNSKVTTPSKNPMQLRGSTSTNRPQSFLSPSARHGTFASKPNLPSNFSSRLTSQSIGPLNFRSPVRPTRPDILTSETSKKINFGFLTDSGTIRLAQGPTRCLSQTARRNEVEGPYSGFTKPYIKQLERPIQETIVVHDDDDVRGNNYDEVDLTLKLGLV